MINTSPKNWLGFVKNPLGLIALFIFLIYSVAAGIMGFGFDKFEGYIERLPLIYFIILFPVIVLFVFYILVTKHHYKLYGPKDFPLNDSFYKLVGIQQEEPEDITKIEHLIDNLSEAQKPTSREETKSAIFEFLEESRLLKMNIPFNEYWKLNHWGGEYGNFRGGDLVFETFPGNKIVLEDGCHIDIVDTLQLGRMYEISCEITCNNSEAGKVKLWCHDNSRPDPGKSSVDSGFIQPKKGELTKLSVYFLARNSRNVRIHIQYMPGEGSTHVRDVRINELKYFQENY